MEEILRLWTPLHDVERFKKMAARSFAVVGLIMILSLSAREGSERYHAMLQGSEAARGSVRTEAGGAGLIGGMGVSLVPEGIAADCGKRSLPILSDILSKADITILPEMTTKDSEAGAEEDMPDRTADMADEKEMSKEPAVSENIDIKDTGEGKPIEIKVIAYGNGGMPESSEAVYEFVSFSADLLSVPERAGKLFDGWYIDAACSLPFETIQEEAETLELYAGWREFPGFTANDQGYLTGCVNEAEAVLDGLLCIPGYAQCKGIEKGAFDIVKDSVFDIYIPANITYIAPGAFDGMDRLMYIEVHPDNPSYYSDRGILYNRDGTVAAFPAARQEK